MEVEIEAMRALPGSVLIEISPVSRFRNFLSGLAPRAANKNMFRLVSVPCDAAPGIPERVYIYTTIPHAITAGVVPIRENACKLLESRKRNGSTRYRKENS